MAPNKTDQMEIVRRVLAMVEDHHALGDSVPLTDAAAHVGVSRDELYEILAPVLYLSFDPSDVANPIDRSWSFLLTEDDLLVLEADHWLADLVTRAPRRDRAIDLYLAGSVVQALAADPDLASALRKLADLAGVTMFVPVELPPALEVVREGWATGRTVVVDYLADGADDAREREIRPWRVYANWGHWYVACGTPEGDERHLRIDRIVAARLGDTTFERPEHVAIPRWFDLEHNARTVRVRIAGEAIASLPGPNRCADRTVAADGTEEVTISVNGDVRLRHLLVALPPEAEVLDPPEFATLRREHAAALLAAYD